MPSRSERIDALARRLSHYDPSQLTFQIAEIAGDQTYLRHGVVVRPGDVVIDAGANVGVAAAFFAEHCGASRVHCFEPVAPVCELLRRNVRDLPACVVHELGLSDAPRHAEITYYPGAAAMSGLYADPQRDEALVRTVLANFGVEDAGERLAGAYEATTLTCELTTLSAFLRETELERVDLLKIDVERAELDVLDGIAEGDWPRIAQVVAEAHDTGEELAVRLRARGFDVVLDQEAAMRGTGVAVVYATRLASGEGESAPLALEPQDSPDHPIAPFFAAARKGRSDRYAGRRPRPRSRALLTMVHNEAVFLPIWLGYYGRFFRPADIFVLDNDSTDGSTARDGFVRIPVSHDAVDHEWMVRTIEELQHDLVGRYDVVVVTDVDEIVAPVPEWGTLDAYLDRFDEESVNCLGYELLHMPTEPPLDLGRPILDQRDHWFINDGYDKAALASVPMRWNAGFHGRADGWFNPDPDLRMIHLHRMDYDLCRARHRDRERRAWADEDARLGWAAHNRITEGAEFERWFYGDSGWPGAKVEPERIRASWRGLF